MTAIVNAHRVFADSPRNNDFIRAIAPVPLEEDALRRARDQIRETLRDSIRNWTRFVKQEEWLEGQPQGTPAAPLRPMFRMQGSFMYHTANDPARKPPQELDLDDGLFLPVSFIAGNGHQKPSILSRGLFQLVELALEARGWVLDKSRASCIRIKVSKHSHIDLAMYSIPDKEFATLAKSLKAERAQQGIPDAGNPLELDGDVYRQLASEHIMLAHRTKGWQPSDPRKLELWFDAAIGRHGPLLRRICRYLKAWRDYQWETCKLSSIVLMACAIDTFNRIGKSLENNRDDLALVRIATELQAQLLQRIDNPVVPGQLLDEGWSPEMRHVYSSRAQVLADTLSTALHRTETASGVLALLQGVLGGRIPWDESLVQIEAPTPAKSREISGAPAVLTTGMLRERGDRPETRRAVEKAGDRRYA